MLGLLEFQGSVPCLTRRCLLLQFTEIKVIAAFIRILHLKMSAQYSKPSSLIDSFIDAVAVY